MGRVAKEVVATRCRGEVKRDVAATGDEDEEDDEEDEEDEEDAKGAVRLRPPPLMTSSRVERKENPEGRADGREPGEQDEVVEEEEEEE